jgi:hypothetical protein
MKTKLLRKLRKQARRMIDWENSLDPIGGYVIKRYDCKPPYELFISYRFDEERLEQDLTLARRWWIRFKVQELRAKQ